MCVLCFMQGKINDMCLISMFLFESFNSDKDLQPRMDMSVLVLLWLSVFNNLSLLPLLNVTQLRQT